MTNQCGRTPAGAEGTYGTASKADTIHSHSNKRSVVYSVSDCTTPEPPTPSSQLLPSGRLQMERRWGSMCQSKHTLVWRALWQAFARRKAMLVSSRDLAPSVRGHVRGQSDLQTARCMPGLHY